MSERAPSGPIEKQLSSKGLESSFEITLSSGFVYWRGVIEGKKRINLTDLIAGSDLQQVIDYEFPGKQLKDLAFETVGYSESGGLNIFLAERAAK